MLNRGNKWFVVCFAFVFLIIPTISSSSNISYFLKEISSIEVTSCPELAENSKIKNNELDINSFIESKNLIRIGNSEKNKLVRGLLENGF